MKTTTLFIPEVILIEPQLFEDERGYFYESFNSQQFQRAVNYDKSFVQSNESFSKQNSIRGLHYQMGKPQGKLVRAVTGEIFDVAVDLRKASPTFGQWVGVILSEHNHHQLWIPEGFAHGFQVLSKTAIVQYQVTDYWCPQFDRCIRYDDATLQVNWKRVIVPDVGVIDPILSDKDRSGRSLDQAEVF